MSITPSPRPIFRERAIKQYIQRKEKDVLPQLISSTVFIALWLLLVFLLIIIMVWLLPGIAGFVGGR